MDVSSASSQDEEVKPNTFQLKDARFPPDVFFEYTPNLRKEKVPIVIDNGKSIVINYLY